MENIIEELINIEKKARETTFETEKEKKDLPQRIEKARIEITTKIEKETNEKIKIMQNNALDESDSKVSELTSNAQEKFALIERDFSENQVKWEEEIFNLIIGGENVGLCGN